MAQSEESPVRYLSPEKNGKFCRSRGLCCRSADDDPPQPFEPETGRSTQSASSLTEAMEQSTASSTAMQPMSLPGSSSPARARSTHLAGAGTGAGAADILLPPAQCIPEEGPWTRSETSPATISLDSPAYAVTTNNPLIYTLEDNKNRTAHNMGLCAEQDTDLLESFRSVIMNEQDGVSADIIQIGVGDPKRSIPPVHFNLLHDEFQPADDRAKARASETIETMVDPHGPALVCLFFQHVHPVYHIVSKNRFLQLYAADRFQIPASLRGAIYGIGSMFWQHLPKQASGEEKGTLQFDLHDLFEEAHSSLQREFHAPNLWKLQACLLLLYERPADNATIETPRTWILSAHTVACAQMIGLHRDSTDWNIAPWEKKLRKRLWWATYNADIWSSVCHGNPPLIYPGSFTTTELDGECLVFDEDLPVEFHHLVDNSSKGVDVSTGARFEQMIKLDRILHRLIDSYYSDACHAASMAQPLRREEDLLDIHTKLEEWASMMPQCTTMAFSQQSPSYNNNGMASMKPYPGHTFSTYPPAPLNLSFFAVQALLYRALMSPAKMSAKSEPTSSLRRHFPHAITSFQKFTQFMSGITQPCLKAYWGGHARSQLTLCGNFLIYLFLLASTPSQVHAAFGLLESFHESLQRLRGWADDDASLALVRPVALRIDSFFIQAARIMRTGMESRVRVGSDLVAS
ncbi:hypothetical protein N7532_008728 [Penicillium argentinense]|uniref:Xylanolytic transcriptional activator regulatory domain-containing protein n=1 Tax=Penicillium argentinense TaxID=1131581 RepID=A0A9W9K1V5_9EURO|nr:uncharacterized protein N7532_008728 [Penicillium argentinense]KAJ5090044.1 hypothetical protein N7532_008728 [Penicillium argentinense]